MPEVKKPQKHQLNRPRLLNRALLILLVIDGLAWVAVTMIGPIYAFFVEKIGGDILSAGLTGSVFALVYGLTTIFSGRLADQIKENELMVVAGNLVMAGAFCGFLFVDSIWMLFVIEAIIGFAQAFFSPAFDAIYSKHLAPDHAGVQWGLWEGISRFGQAGGAALGGFIAFKFGFNPVFIIMAAICCFNGIFIYCLPREVL